MSLINAIAFGARHVLISKLHEDLLSDETITNHLRYKAIEELKAFVQQQMASMSTAEAVASLDEIKDLDLMVLSMEIYEDLPAAFFLKEIVSTQVYTVLSPVIAALNKDDATPSSVNAAALEIEEQKLQIGQQTQTTPAELESGLCQEDLDATDLGALNDHVYEMFFAQNSVIDMDLRFDMIDMVSTADEGKRGDLQNYAAKVEEFLEYAKENPEKVSNALSLLKGTGDA